MVGGSGVFVNLIVVYLSKKIAGWCFDLHEDDIFMNLLGTSFNIRWYHIFLTIAFLIANTWNYQLNRMWTFRSSSVGWVRGFFAFLAIGVLAFLVNLTVTTLLMNPTSPLALPSDIFDNSTGLRTKLYYATAIGIFVSMPVNFLINKLWTFRKAPASKVIIQTEPTVTR